MPALVVGIAVIAAPSVQLLKKASPGLRGWKSLVASFVVCFVGAVTTSANPHADIQTVPFWAGVLQATIAAAGIHGIGKGLGLFGNLFTLPEDQKNPLLFQCPHTDNDAQGRPLSMCKGAPGKPCTLTVGGSDFALGTIHAERIALVTGGEKVSAPVAEAAAEEANAL